VVLCGGLADVVVWFVVRGWVVQVGLVTLLSAVRGSLVLLTSWLSLAVPTVACGLFHFLAISLA
jgi:hypothetical protein